MKKSQWFLLILFKLHWVLAIFGQGEWLLWQALSLFSSVFFIKKYQWPMIAILFFGGVTIDVLLIQANVLTFNLKYTLIPLFLIALWLQFSITMTTFNNKIPTQFWRAGLLLALIGAWGYGAAHLLNATTLMPSILIGMAIIGLCWLFVFAPLMFLGRTWLPPQPPL